jgi:hypothetical protein
MRTPEPVVRAAVALLNEEADARATPAAPAGAVDWPE